MRGALILLVLGYAAVCILAGLTGIVAAAPEMRLFYHLDPAAAPGRGTADLMGQFGFMKAIEFGFGLFTVARLGPIIERGSERGLFCVVVAAGLLARVLAWLRYGRPDAVFLVFLILEVLLLAVLLIESRDGDAA